MSEKRGYRGQRALFFPKLCPRECGTPLKRNAKMGKRETTAWGAKANRLGDPMGESGDACTGM